MAKNNKESKKERFRVSLVNDITHKQLWFIKFTRSSLLITIVSIIIAVMACLFAIIAFTPLKSLIPGVPDAHSQRTAVQNAIRIDSLERVILRWDFYAENLKRVVNGEDPVKIDSIIKSQIANNDSVANIQTIHRSDSLLRKAVNEADRMGMTSRDMVMPIEGMHFFSPLKGVVSQGFDRAIHPYIDITAPANSVVTSVLDGTVVSAGWSDESGYTILIQHPNNIISVYKHNQKLLKKQGDHVSAGATIALVGNTGSITTGEHLHFELWYKGNAVDPTKYINF